MSTFYIYTSSDQEEWKAILTKMNDADIYSTAEYCTLAEKNGEGKAILFVYQEGNRIVTYPYLMRRINELDLPACKEIQEDLYDITTPYGYGGPTTNVTNPSERYELFSRFSEVFEKYCVQNRIVSEFVRFHPVIKNYEYYVSVNPIHIRDTICLKLTDQEEEMMESFRTKGRNRLKHAMKSGLTISHEDPNNIDVFLDQYYKTMEKNNASSYYYFNRDYFVNLSNLLKDHINLFAVRYEGKIIASTFFLHYDEHVAYHLTGSDQQFLKYAPYNLLIYYAACWYGKKGYKHLHLGGGYEGNEDELFRFKKTFTKELPLQFYIGRKVHCPEIYEKLITNLNVSSEYFPLYRHPNIESIKQIM